MENSQPEASERRRQRLRFTLGQLQMLGATMGAISLFTSGLTAVTIVVLCVTGVISITSLVLFRWRNRK